MIRIACSLLLASTASSCASQPKPPPVTAAASATPAVQSPAAAAATPTAAPQLNAQELQGSWVEYWALSGHADTQRYTFSEDGRFVWQPAQASLAGAPGRSGRWQLEAAGTSACAVLLSFDGEAAPPACASGADCKAADTQHPAQRLPLGECPPDDEAKALDASYRCVVIGGHTFWHHAERAPAE
jgi:hypothetical protein